MGQRLERLWPSLVALVGTVAVVLLLLWVFGGDVNDSTPGGAVAGENGAEADGPTTGSTGSASPAPGDQTPPPSDEPEPSEPSTPSEPTQTEPSTAPPDVRRPVGIANQTATTGLAAEAQDRLESGGWDVPAVSSFNGTVPETTVYYPEGMREAAEALSAQFPEIGRIKPTFEGLNPDRLVVVLVDDYIDEVSSQ